MPSTLSWRDQTFHDCRALVCSSRRRFLDRHCRRLLVQRAQPRRDDSARSDGGGARLCRGLHVRRGARGTRLVGDRANASNADASGEQLAVFTVASPWPIAVAFAVFLLLLGLAIFPDTCRCSGWRCCSLGFFPSRTREPLGGDAMKIVNAMVSFSFVCARWPIARRSALRGPRRSRSRPGRNFLPTPRTGRRTRQNYCTLPRGNRPRRRFRVPSLTNENRKVDNPDPQLRGSRTRTHRCPNSTLRRLSKQDVADVAAYVESL